MVGAEGADQAGHGLGTQGVQEAEGDLAGGRVGVLLHGFGGAGDLAERPLGGGEEGAPGGGEGDGAALAGEQRDGQVLFEADHGPGQGGLRHAQFVRGAGDVLVPGDRDEVGEPGASRLVTGMSSS